MMQIRRAVADPKYLILGLMDHGWFNWLPDRGYLRLRFRLSIGTRLNLRNPKTYSEKLQWLKLYDRRPEYIEMADKIRVKELVAAAIGEEYVIPTIGTWDRAEQIDFDALPNQFVLKCNHDSGSTVICRDKQHFSKEAAVKKLNRCLRKNGYWFGREWPYKQITPKIMAEPYIEDAKTGQLIDYKFMCFDGVPKVLLVISNRQNKESGTTLDYCDMDYQRLDFKNGYQPAEQLPEKPQHFEEMKRISETLSKGIPHVRVDLYEANGKLYFGELTFFQWSGFYPFDPPCWDEKIGAWLRLPKPFRSGKTSKRERQREG